MLVIIYDGECPLCSRYVQYYRVQDAAGSIRLINARTHSPERDKITAMGWDLDQGMVAVVGNKYYFGGDAIHVLALMGTRHGWFNRLNYFLFCSPLLTRLLYPLCKAGRRMALYLRGVPPIRNLPENG